MKRSLALLVCLLPLLSADAQLQAHTVAPDAATSWNLGTYGYDQAGNIRQIGSKIYVYDSEGRLSYEKAGTQKQQELTYDGFGNILTITAGTTVRTPGANAATNRAGFGTYDGAGNMITAGTSTFTYDALNVMTKSTTDASRAYVYNANDERIAVITLTAPNGTEVNSQWTVRDPAGQVLRRFWREGGQWRWMQDYMYRDGKMLASESNDQLKTLHYHLDHLGTPRLITGNGGTEVARHTYYPFGEEAPGATPQVAEPKKFTGHERDGGGVDYMHARFYDYGMGRFLSVDPGKAEPLRSQTWNRYTYAENNAILKTDPDGRQAVVPASAVGPVAPLAAAAYHAHQMQTNDEYRRAAVDQARTGALIVVVVATGLVNVLRTATPALTLVDAPAEARNTPQVGRGRPRPNEQYRYPNPPNNLEPGDPRKQPPPPVVVEDKKAKAVWKIIEGIIKAWMLSQ